MFHSIVVICTGNICRSPIAEVLLRGALPAGDVHVSSAGIAALTHHPADPLAQIVAKENGHDISIHRAQQATKSMLSSMDLILTLDQTHNDWIQTRYPQLQGRTFKLGRWRNNSDIADPYRKPKIAFEQAFTEIQLCIDSWAQYIRNT